MAEQPPQPQQQQQQSTEANSDRRKLQESITALHERFTSYSNPTSLKLGDIVVWKENLANRRFPRPGQIAIVTRVFPQPIVDSKKNDAGSPYFHESLDLVLGIFDSDGDFVEFHYDSGRFMKLEDPSKYVARHLGVTCDGCQKSEFEGLRFKCDVCDNFDLCAACKFEGKTTGSHTTEHSMRLIEAPNIERLTQAFQSLNSEIAIKPGDLVQWKIGLKNKTKPTTGEFAIVIDVLPAPVFDSKKGASVAYFREPLDVRLGILDEDGRRFMKVM